MKTSSEKLNILELFSGIGGMYYSFLYANINCQTTPIDTNPIANQVYSYNFPQINPLALNIASIKTDSPVFNNYFDVWTLSPPCQPFSKQSTHPKGIDDPRCDGLSNITFLLNKLNYESLPWIIVMENVINFHESLSFIKFRDALYSRGYTFRIFLLSPLEFGFPNQRARFYLIAKLTPLRFPDELGENLNSNIIEFDQLMLASEINCEGKSTFLNNECYQYPFYKFFMPSITTFLEDENISLIIDPSLLKNPKFQCFDIVKETETCCQSKIQHRKPPENLHQVNENNFCLLDNIDGTINTAINYPASKSESFKAPTLFKNQSHVNFSELSSSRPYTLCFTRNYGRYNKGTGSVLVTKENSDEFIDSLLVDKENKNSALRYTTNYHIKEHTKFKKILPPKAEKSPRTEALRYFSPLEIARLMGFKMRSNPNNIKSLGNALWDLNHPYHLCFPVPNLHYCSPFPSICKADIDNNFYNHRELEKKYLKNTKCKGCNCYQHPFEFPQQLNRISQWRLIGNSLNPQVVAILLTACGITNLKQNLKAERFKDT